MREHKCPNRLDQTINGLYSASSLVQGLCNIRLRTCVNRAGNCPENSQPASGRVIGSPFNRCHLWLCFKLCVSFYLRYGGGPPRFGGGGGGNRGGPPQGKFGNPGERLRKKHWNLDELPKFQKNFYQEHPDSTRRPLVRFAFICFSFQRFVIGFTFFFSLILTLTQNSIE